MSVSLDLCLNGNCTSTEVFVLITDLLFLEPIIVPDIPDQILQRGIFWSPAWDGSDRYRSGGEGWVSTFRTLMST